MQVTRVLTTKRTMRAALAVLVAVAIWWCAEPWVLVPLAVLDHMETRYEPGAPLSETRLVALGSRAVPAIIYHIRTCGTAPPSEWFLIDVLRSDGRSARARLTRAVDHTAPGEERYRLGYALLWAFGSCGRCQ
jgi:hypothetical protein